MVAEAETPTDVQAMCIVQGRQGADKVFHKMQLSQEGKCKMCKRKRQTRNLKPQQPLIGMMFTNADPRYAGRLDNKQGGDTIVTMERVEEASAFNAELADEST